MQRLDLTVSDRKLGRGAAMDSQRRASKPRLNPQDGGVIILGSVTVLGGAEPF